MAIQTTKPEQEYRQRMVRRLAALILLAQSQRYMPSLRSLAREHGCSVRTIRRDLEAIEQLMPVRWRQLEAA
jgi:DeoR/GlpR family transcriptional regulator of sugar metabolism